MRPASGRGRGDGLVRRSVRTGGSQRRWGTCARATWVAASAGRSTASRSNVLVPERLPHNPEPHESMANLGPPILPFRDGTNSRIYVPLLLDAAGVLFFFFSSRTFLRLECGGPCADCSYTLFFARSASSTPQSKAAAHGRGGRRLATGGASSKRVEARTSLSRGWSPSTLAVPGRERPRRLAPNALAAENASKADQRDVKAAMVAGRNGRGTARARQRARRRTNWEASGLQRTPTSSARTTSRHLCERINSG